MKSVRQKCLALVAAFGLLLTGAPMTAYAENAADTGSSDFRWEISKSKEATDLDENNVSEVTLALPAADYERTMDVVFVIDDTHAGSVIFEDAVSGLLDDLASKENLDIRVGIIAFDSVSRDWLEATSGGTYSGMVSIKDEGALNALKTAASTQLSYSGEGSMKKVGGTNTEWPIAMATEMLQTGNGEDKYMVMFSDLYSYIYRGQLTLNGTTYDNVPLSKRLGTWDQGSMSMGTKYDTFADAYANRAEGDETADGFFRDSSWESYWTTYQNLDSAPENTIKNDYQVDSHTFSGFEKSLCLTYDRLVEASANANVILINNSFYTGDSPSAQNMVQEMLTQLTETTNAKTYVYQTDSADEALSGDVADGIFAGLREDLIQLVDAGSSVVDEIGQGEDDAGNAYDFDFVNDIDQMTMTRGLDVNGDPIVLAKTQIDETTVGFGEQLADGSYEFVLHYYANGQDGTSNECFVWDINVPVTKDAPVKLTYHVVLTDPCTQPGTYSNLYTNLQAVLYPVDSNGTSGESELFERPSVSYTVANTEEPQEPSDPQQPDVPQQPEEPNESADGDSTNTAAVNVMAGWGMAAVLSGAILCVIHYKRRLHR